MSKEEKKDGDYAIGELAVETKSVIVMPDGETTLTELEALVLILRKLDKIEKGVL